MAYTVKKLAEISKVSIRTLHFYDEIGLLKPAYLGSNGYRFYEEEQLLILQQILFYRELGFEFKQIHKILKSRDFDKIAALISHRQVLLKNVEKTKDLITTIDKTIAHLKGTKKMKDKEMYHGFSKEKQAEYLTYLKNRLGSDHPSFAESEKNVKSWTQEAWEKSDKQFNSICAELAKLKEKHFPCSSPEVQTIIRRHCLWLKDFWTPNRQSYIGLGQLYVELEWKKVFGPHDHHHPHLAQFLAEAMKFFAEQELS